MDCSYCYSPLILDEPHLCLPMYCVSCFAVKDNFFYDKCFSCIGSRTCHYCSNTSYCIFEGLQYCKEHSSQIPKDVFLKSDVARKERILKYEKELEKYSVLIVRQRHRLVNKRYRDKVKKNSKGYIQGSRG